MNSQKWVAVWGSAPSVSEARPAQYAKNITLRYTLRAMLDGTKIRLHFSNLGGAEDVRITRVYVSSAQKNAVPVTFQGNTGCFIAAGGNTSSDEVDFALTRGTDYTVSLYLGDITLLTSGTNITGPLCRIAYAEGDYAAAPVLPSRHSKPIDTAFFLTGVDALADAQAHALVCFGDSITAQAWPDYLMLRVLREKRENLSVIRRGIGGSRVLRRYTHLQHRHYGPDGADRFEREVAAAGADRVIILHGVNDIIHPQGSEFRPWSDLPTAEELIDGLRWYISKGHALGLKVYLATIMTIKGWTSYTPEREAIRHDVNAWIRSQTEADGVVDFDAATRSAADPDSREALYDRGDHLHPSLEGAEKMAESVPAEYLL